MFQFRAFPSYDYFIHRTIPEYCSGVFPHSDISGSMLICSSPKLFAACHVLHRLLMPRHSPCALISLTYYSLITILVLLNYAGSTEVCLQNCIYPWLKVSTIKFLKCNHFWLRPLLPCFFIISSLFSFQGAISCCRRWWRIAGSNRWPPECKSGALPAELIPHI